MTPEETTALSRAQAKKEREARRAQRLFQSKKARIAASYIRYGEFEKALMEEPSYYATIRRMVARISQEIAHESNMRGARLPWDEARDRILTLERLESLERMYGKSFRTVLGDVARYASHANWLKQLYARGDGGILSDVIRELRDADDAKHAADRPVIVIAEPARPIPMTARQVSEDVARKNAEFEKIDREFRGDDRPGMIPVGRTGEFAFLAETPRDKTKRPPRRNARREIG